MKQTNPSSIGEIMPGGKSRPDIFCTLFIVERQYHNRKHVFHIVLQMLAFGLDFVSRETLLQAKNSTSRRWNLNPSPCR